MSYRACGVLLGGALLASCGGGGAGATPTPSASAPAGTVNTGSMVDFAVSGLRYSTTTLSGTTSSTGSFSYRCEGSTCEQVLFGIGAIQLGTVPGSASVSLKDFLGGMAGGTLSSDTIHRAQFLIALDSDGNASNGISLSAELATSLSNQILNFGSASFDSDLGILLDYLKADSRLPASFRNGLTLPSATAARMLAEQAEGISRGPLVESPASQSTTVAEVRKYVVKIPDGLRVPYSGSSSSVKLAFPQGLIPPVGYALKLASGSTGTNIQLVSLAPRGIVVSAPGYFDGTIALPASVMVGSETSAGPSLAALSLSNSSADLQSVSPLRTSTNGTLSGRPTPIGSSGNEGSRNLDEALQPRNPEFDQFGLDPVGLAVMQDGTYWTCDRRGPFLVQLDTAGHVLQRLGPGGALGSLPDVLRKLPAILESRQAGLGCGGLAARTSSGELIFALGAALNVGGKTAESSRLLRLIGYQPRTGAVRQFAIGIGAGEIALRILDLESLSEDRILAIVRYRDGSKTAPYKWQIRAIDLSAATDIGSKLLSSGPNSGLALEYGTAGDLDLSGIRLASTTTLIELGAFGWTLESPTGLARIDAQTLAVVGSLNGGVHSQITGGDPALAVDAHQVDRNGIITPKSPSATAPATFEIVPNSLELQRMPLWKFQLRNSLN